MQVEPVVARPVAEPRRRRDWGGVVDALLWIAGIVLAVGIAAGGCVVIALF